MHCLLQVFVLCSGDGRGVARPQTPLVEPSGVTPALSDQDIHRGLHVLVRTTAMTSPGILLSKQGGSQMSGVEFKAVTIVGEETGRKLDAVAVIRDGRQVALLPEADRADRALSLPLEEIQYIIGNFPSLMGRQPTRDERELWRAVLDFRVAQDRKASPRNRLDMTSPGERRQAG